MVVLPIQYILVINASRRFRPESCVPLFYALCMQWQTIANTMVCKNFFHVVSIARIFCLGFNNC